MRRASMHQHVSRIILPRFRLFGRVVSCIDVKRLPTSLWRERRQLNGERIDSISRVVMKC